MDQPNLLTTPLAERLFHETAEPLPILDRHNHLPIRDLAENRPYADLTEVLLLSDPYKHRVMRILGYPEEVITGDAEPWEKFRVWCEAYVRLVGHPIADWSRLEMERVFGITQPLSPQNAREIWETANDLLRLPEYTAKGIFDRFRVRYCAPCTALEDELSPYEGLPECAPSLRGDGIVSAVRHTAELLGSRYGESCGDWERFSALLLRRLREFHDCRCRVSDHAVDAPWSYYPDDGKKELRFAACIGGQTLTAEDQARLSCDVLRLCAGLYRKLDWVMQLHIGALRYTSTRLRKAAGGAGGFAGIGATPVAEIAAFLDDCEKEDALPRTILYSMEPASWEELAVLSGSFNRAGENGYVQLGAAWWWSDHAIGIRRTLDAVKDYAVLSAFSGMTTDSRSILSFSRHEYFRRVLCGWMGEKVRQGQITAEENQLKETVRAICWQNEYETLTKRGIIL